MPCWFDASDKGREGICFEGWISASSSSSEEMTIAPRGRRVEGGESGADEDEDVEPID